METKTKVFLQIAFIAISATALIPVTGILITQSTTQQTAFGASCQSLGIPDCHGCAPGSNGFIHSKGNCMHPGAPGPELGRTTQ